MRRPGTWVLGLAAAFLYLPLGVLTAFSFNDSALMAFPLSGFTWRWYGQVLQHASLLQGLLTSMLIALPVAALSTVLGLCAALGITSRLLRWRLGFATVLALPFLVPKGMLAVAQVMLLSRLGVSRGPGILILAQALTTLPFTMLIVLTALLRLDPRLEEAARDLGATPWQSFRRVVLPLLRSALGAAYSVGMILSLSDLSLSMFLAGRTQPLSVIVASAFRRELSPELNAMQVILLCLTALIVAVGGVTRGALSQHAKRRAAPRSPVGSPHPADGALLQESDVR